MKTILEQIDTFSSLDIQLEQAVTLLKQGEVVAFPTETVYGLGANALDEDAIQKIFIAKNRPNDNPLIIHISSLEMLSNINLKVSNQYLEIIQKFWPGPLTILLPKSDLIPCSVTAGHDTVAVRMPNHPLALKLIEKCGFPLAAPSANTSSRPSPTIAQHVYEDLNGRIKLIIDGGPCLSGLESTVLDARTMPPCILRPGGISLEQIKSCKGFENTLVWKKDFVNPSLEQAPTTPGMKYRHYTPNATVILAEHGPKISQRLKILEEASKHKDSKIGILRTEITPDSPTDFVEKFIGTTAIEVASNLFKGLRDLEKENCKVIFVEGISQDKEGLAVMNRLYKAASQIIKS